MATRRSARAIGGEGEGQKPKAAYPSTSDEEWSSEYLSGDWEWPTRARLEGVYRQGENVALISRVWQPAGRLSELMQTPSSKRPERVGLVREEEFVKEEYLRLSRG